MWWRKEVFLLLFKSVSHKSLIFSLLLNLFTCNVILSWSNENQKKSNLVCKKDVCKDESPNPLFNGFLSQRCVVRANIVMGQYHVLFEIRKVFSHCWLYLVHQHARVVDTVYLSIVFILNASFKRESSRLVCCSSVTEITPFLNRLSYKFFWFIQFSSYCKINREKT